MSKFKSQPQSSPATPLAAVDRFVAGASHREAPAALDPGAKPTLGINLRLNEYELDLLRRLAKADDRSIQRTIKRLLIPAARKAAGE